MAPPDTFSLSASYQSSASQYASGPHRDAISSQSNNQIYPWPQPGISTHESGRPQAPITLDDTETDEVGSELFPSDFNHPSDSSSSHPGLRAGDVAVNYQPTFFPPATYGQNWVPDPRSDVYPGSNWSAAGVQDNDSHARGSSNHSGGMGLSSEIFIPPIPSLSPPRSTTDHEMQRSFMQQQAGVYTPHDSSVIPHPAPYIHPSSSYDGHLFMPAPPRRDNRSYVSSYLSSSQGENDHTRSVIHVFDKGPAIVDDLLFEKLDYDSSSIPSTTVAIPTVFSLFRGP